MIIPYSYGTKLHNSKFLGIKPCGNCKKFAEQYLARSWFSIKLFWVLPIFGFPTGRYLRCNNCKAGYKLTREQWKELKLAAADMPKKRDYRQAYEALKAIVTTASPEDLTVDTVYSRLMSQLEFDDNGRHIRDLVVTYLQNSQAAAAVMKPQQQGEVSPAIEVLPAPAAETAPAVEAAPAEAPAVTRSAETAAPAVQAPAAAAYTAPQYGSAAPVAAPAAQQYGTVPARRERSKARFLWLIPALLLLPIALILDIAVLDILFTEPDPDMFVNIFIALFGIIPTALNVLFFVLAFKKYKK